MLSNWLPVVYRLIILISLPACCCLAQYPAPDLERGNFYYKNYSIKEYGASFQNWGAVQDKYGIMYFANGDGVLIYDGTTWTLVETPTASVIRSMAIDAAGKVWVGALDDFGFIDRDKNGAFIYRSVAGRLKPALRSFGNIWSTHVYKGRVYFEAETGIYRYTGKDFKFWPFKDQSAFHKSFFWNNVLYVYESGSGLMKLEDDQFSAVTAGDAFTSRKIYAALPFDKDKLLLITKYQGLFVYDGTQVSPFSTDADAYLKNNHIYSAVQMPGGLFALATLKGGVVVLNRKGQVQYTITKENGLPTNIVYGLTVDREGDLWLSSDNGISRFEVNNNFSSYMGKAGLEGTPNDICRYNGKLYIATSVGLYVLKPARYPDKQSYFDKVPLITATCWGLLPVQNRMLVTSDNGLFEMDGHNVRQVSNTSAGSVHRCKADSTRIVVAGQNTLESWRLVNGNWRRLNTITGINVNDVKFCEAYAGKLWLSTYSQGAVLVSFTQADGSVNYDQPTIRRYGPADGLPEGYIKINSVAGEEIFRVGSKSLTYRFNYHTRRFEPYLFGKQFGFDYKNSYPVTNQDASGRFWVNLKPGVNGGKYKLIVTPNADARHRVKKIDLSRILETVGLITYPEPGGMVWYAAFGGIIRHNMNGVAGGGKPFQTYINKIILPPDSVFFRGISGARQQVSFPYSYGSPRFEFTSANYTAPEANMFQYKLQGMDKNWSEWTKDNTKEYTGLWEGDYTFLVRSRNYAGRIGKTDSFSFVISPPWFRTIYAYMLYLSALIVSVWGIIRWRSYQLRQEREVLKKEIAERTHEITMQNIQLENQSEELKINAGQLKELDKLKSNFFVNISHEFRTPLSLILGPLEKLIEEKEPAGLRLNELERMYRNAKRLKQLINQLLDLAKLESGGMKLALRQADLLYFLRVLTSSFESLAERRNIRYEVNIPANSYQTYFDSEKIETVLYNLLSNAFKFTPDGGRIDFELSLQNNPSQISITVSDTGPGIDPEEAEKIFDRFYQVDSSSLREYEGSGIGLSLAKELVLLMGGTIAVKSAPGQGTLFTVDLPVQTWHGPVEAPDNYTPTEPIYAGTTNTDASKPAEQNPSVLFTEKGKHESDLVVLLIEDNADLRSYIKENLEDEYQVITAENGQLGWETAIEVIPDLIISDMMMPVMDGFTLCTKIRADERTSHIPFILLTARTTIENKLEGLELGADEYMTKPFNLKEVKVRMKNLLEQRKSLRKSFSRQLVIQPKNISVTSVDERFLNHALEILEVNLADEQFSVEKFADAMGMSRKNLLRKITALTDQSVNEFIRNFRLKRAASLLANKSGNVSEIAYQVGFNNLSYFSKCFRELFGVLPTEYSEKSSSYS